jgi:hypothetical protein
MRMAVHVAHMGNIIYAYSYFTRRSEGRYYSEDLGLVGKIILKYILGKYGGRL